jgi:hypothetical protein
VLWLHEILPIVQEKTRLYSRKEQISMQITSSSSPGSRREENGYQGEMDALTPHWSPRIVYIRADVTHLASPLIPFAVFKDTPLVSFHAAREARWPFARAENAAEMVASLWNQPFTALTEAQRYFLVAWSAAPRISPRVVPLAELAFGIATPGPYYKRWITTCAVIYQKEPVAWCIEIDMLGEQQEVIEIVLTRENLQRLLPSQAGQNARVA